MEREKAIKFYGNVYWEKKSLCQLLSNFQVFLPFSTGLNLQEFMLQVYILICKTMQISCPLFLVAVEFIRAKYYRQPIKWNYFHNIMLVKCPV